MRLHVQPGARLLETTPKIVEIQCAAPERTRSRQDAPELHRVDLKMEGDPRVPIRHGFPKALPNASAVSQGPGRISQGDPKPNSSRAPALLRSPQPSQIFCYPTLFRSFSGEKKSPFAKKISMDRRVVAEGPDSSVTARSSALESIRFHSRGRPFHVVRRRNPLSARHSLPASERTRLDTHFHPASARAQSVDSDSGRPAHCGDQHSLCRKAGPPYSEIIIWTRGISAPGNRLFYHRVGV